ncbi:hypothetical protein AURDEDRAFT_184961 [Auricularia subglabra TFB-10046 SS5]|nr:hypothetical protein AURDEDRAFT_184961 [Auricularia subglabra TFB-10046 SS5]
MLLSSDQQVLLRRWFDATRADHARVHPYDVLNLPGRCRLDDAKRLCIRLADVFHAAVVGDAGACSEELLAPYLPHINVWVQALIDPDLPGDDASNDHLGGLLVSIQKFVLTLGSREVQLHNERKVAVGRPPADIFLLIFALLSFKDLIIASHVCQAWRQFSLACPSLWTNLDLHENELPKDVCLRGTEFSQLVNRSRAAPLGLLVTNVRRQTLVDLNSCLVATLCRIRTLDLSFVSNVRLKDKWIDALLQPAPVLEYLRLASGRRRRGHSADCMIPIPQDLFLGNAPRLRKVYLGMLNLPASCPALADVRQFTGHFIEDARAPKLRQDRQTRLVYKLCPRLDSLDLCWIEDAEVLPPLPADLPLKRVIMNAALVDEPGSISRGVYRAVSGLGDLSRLPFARAISGDVAAVMRLWCDPLPPWRTVLIEKVKVENPLIGPVGPLLNISVKCGDAGSDLKTREFAFAAIYISSDDGLIQELKSRIAPARTCVIDPRAFWYSMGRNLLSRATALEELHIILDDDYEQSMHMTVVLSLPALKRLKVTTPPGWKAEHPAGERIVRIHAGKLAQFLSRQVKAPQLESLTVSGDIKLDDSEELQRGLTEFSKSIVVE